MSPPAPWSADAEAGVGSGQQTARGLNRLAGHPAIRGIIVLLLALSGCRHSSVMSDAEKIRVPNRALLDEATQSKAWFHARKTRPIWARKLERDQTVQTLEGPVAAQAGDFLCRGAAGELWPQKASTLEERYTPTGTVDPDGWREFAPRPDTEGVLAAQVQHPFTVIARWGRLTAKAGDFVVKNFRDRDQPYPEDVWVVDQALFRATYERVER